MRVWYNVIILHKCTYIYMQVDISFTVFKTVTVRTDTSNININM